MNCNGTQWKADLPSYGVPPPQMPENAENVMGTLRNACTSIIKSGLYDLLIVQVAVALLVVSSVANF